ncbi:hydantoinase B/oxoprolinase family protein [Aquamicrobium zhengzhouense]|uniref:Hydantoinase B/oxoprolinase family protein n=1 Tax=Aquamicrobium zhengzhouense TaxID=2781738 RepID=A0ABS0SJ57_9HYPH|nr:hydantoinase B/oxoprolinase family protein [Aquamicrobium zhengzhouense]MBI1622765.1 hydantoinase B/oxoprolinase family protein [Aquamicrobium zhengzhouense]
MNAIAQTSTLSAIDPVTLTVVEKGLQQVCTEMDLVHEKTSFSPVISEAYDRSNGIYGIHDGRMISQGETGLPIFLGVMQECVHSVIKERAQHLKPGDVIIVNDPYRGGTHLMDVKMVMPFYYQGKLWCYLANAGHWPDTGGMVPGGFSTTATEIHQEGLRIPPVKIMEGGVIVQDIVDFVLANIRVSEERIGDIYAQIAALRAGERALTALIDRYGLDVVNNCVAEIEDRAETMMRAHIADIPDGVYSASAFIDSDGVVNEPLEVALDVTVSGTNITFDFSRSSKPCRGPLNSVWATTQSAVFIGMKHIFPNVPMNAGCFAPLNVLKPKGTFLYAEYPRPVAGCSAEVSQRIMEAVFLALAKAIPDKLFAAPAGTSGNLSLGGFDPETGEHYIMYYFSGGGYGGWWDGDGISNGCSTIGISKSQPVEILEQRYPLLFERYALREGSAGAGQFRGGMGVDYRMRLLRGEGTASFLMEHGRFGPPGVLGGEDGQPNRIRLNIQGREFEPEHLSKGENFRLQEGDYIEVGTPGGGGYGAPENRDAQARVADERLGYNG